MNAVMAILQIVISMGVLFVLYRFLLRHLGIENLGIWSLLIGSVTAARVSELGIGGGVTRFVARYSGRGERQTAAEVVETGFLSIGLLMGLLLLAGYPALEWWLGKAVSGPALKVALALLPYAVLSVWLSSLFGVALAGLDGSQRIDLRCILMLVSQGLMLLLAVVLVPRHGLQGLIWAQIIQNVFLMLAGWLILKRELRTLPWIPHRWGYRLFREMLGYGLQFQVAGLAMMLCDPITKALLSRFGGLDLVGYYEMANQMVTKSRALVIAGNQALVPTVAQSSESSPGYVQRIYRDAYEAVLYVALPSFAAVMAATPIIAIIWIGRPQPDFINFSIIIALAWLINTVNSPAYFANLGTGRLLWNTASHLVIGILNAGLGLGLGIMFGGTGVVIGWAIALALGSMVILLGWRRDHGPEEIAHRAPAPFRLLLLACAAAAVLGALAGRTFAGILPLPVLAAAVVAGFCVLVVPAVWMHPMRSRLLAWVRQVLVPRNLGMARRG